MNPQVFDLSQYITSAVDQLVNEFGNPFLGMVESYLFWALVAGIAISGLHFLFVSSQQGMRFLWTTLLTYGLVVWFLRYYDNPMPVIGIPFSQIFRMESRFLATKIDITLLNSFLDRIKQLLQGPGWLPSPTNQFESMGYYIILGTLAIPQIVLFAETTFAIIALAIGSLLGPLFLFLYILPFQWTKQMFWSWFYYMVKYSLYRVVAAALVYIWATAEMNFLNNVFTGQLSLGMAVGTLLGLLVFAGVCCITCLRVPRLVSDLTSGQASAGGGVAPAMAMVAWRLA